MSSTTQTALQVLRTFGATQSEIATKLHLSQDTISRIVRGVRKPSKKVIAAICKQGYLAIMTDKNQVYFMKEGQ